VKSRLSLAWWVSAGSRGQLLRAALGAVVAVAGTVALCSLGAGGRLALEAELLGEGHSVRVRPPSFGIGPLDLVGTLIPEKPMNPAALAAIRASPGVSAAWPEAWSRFPVRFRGTVAGRTLYTDGAILGIDPEALGPEAPPDWDWSPGEPVPILAPKALLVAYNRGFAPANGLPRLTEKAALGLRLKLVGLGENGERVTLPAEISGAVRYSGELAGIVPLSVVEHMSQELGMDAAWSSALVRGAPGASPDALQRDLQGLGWAIEEVGGVARQLSVAIGAIETVVQLAGGLLVGAALLLLAQVHAVLLRQRGRDLRVLRALGASRRLLLGLLAVEVVAVAWAAALVGIAAGMAGAAVSASAASAYLTEALGVAIPLVAELPAGMVSAFLLGAPLVALLAGAPAMVRALSGPALETTE
jgi:hypothetical protein